MGIVGILDDRQTSGGARRSQRESCLSISRPRSQFGDGSLDSRYPGSVSRAHRPHPPGAASGTDIDEQGYGTVGEARMYQLIRQSEKITDRESEIEFLTSGVSVYDFTFG